MAAEVPDMHLVLHFVRALGLPDPSSAQLSAMRAAGIRTPLELAEVFPGDFMRILGLSKSGVPRALANASLPQLMVASGLFGLDFTPEEAQEVVMASPGLVGMEALNPQKMDEFEVEDRVRELINRQLPAFADWLYQLGLWDKFTSQEHYTHYYNMLRDLEEGPLVPPSTLQGTRVTFIDYLLHDKRDALKAGAIVVPYRSRPELVTYRGPEQDYPEVAEARLERIPVLGVSDFAQLYRDEIRAARNNVFSATEYSRRTGARGLPASLEGARVATVGYGLQREKASVEIQGGQLTSGISRNTDLVIVAMDGTISDKLFEAGEKRVPVVTAEQFNRLYPGPQRRPLEGVRVALYLNYTNTRANTLLELAGAQIVPERAFFDNYGELMLPSNLGLVVFPDPEDQEGGEEEIQALADAAGVRTMTETQFVDWLTQLLGPGGDRQQQEQDGLVEALQAIPQVIHLHRLVLTFAGRSGLKEAKEVARSYGALVDPDLSRDVEMVVAQDGLVGSSKVDKARTWNIPVLSASEFLRRYRDDQPAQQPAQQPAPAENLPVLPRNRASPLQGMTVSSVGLRGRPLADLKADLVYRGAAVSPNLVRGTSLLVATPEASESIKAVRARRWGIPVVTPEEFRARYL